MIEAGRPGPGQDIVIVTGPGGAGRTTAIGALEDLGFEAIDNMPLSLLPRLFGGAPLERPTVIGIDPRNRDFGVERLIAAIARIAADPFHVPVLVYLDCDAGTLIRRYNETRRRHPMSPNETPAVGIARERALLAPLQALADVLVDTSAMTPHDLRAEMVRQFGAGRPGDALAVSLQSFSYKRGVPRGIDMVMDTRFLRNPHWNAELRPRTGLDPEVASFVWGDPNCAPFFAKLVDLLGLLLPAYRGEGKSYFSLGLGCTGGKHRSVALVESLAKSLAADGWQVSIRHRDLEHASAGAAESVKVGTG